MESRLVGRDRELPQLEALLGKGGVLALVGAPGIGKSAVARSLHRRRVAERPARSLFVDAVESDARSAITAALALPLDASAAALANALSDAGTELVVVDTLVPTAGTEELLAELAGRATSTGFLLVGRERAAGSALTAYRLGPLPVPAPGPEEVERAPSVELFLERASRLGQAARIEEQPVTLAAIVRATEGHPLAIELAASQLVSLDPDELLERMTDGSWRELGLSEALAESSWRMLGEVERSVLAQCCVFAGGFSVAAAEAVVDASGSEVAGVLQALLDRCLLTPVGMTERLRVLAVLRSLIVSRPETSDVVRAARRRHREHFLWLAGAPSADDLWREDRDNLLAAVDDLDAPAKLRLQAIDAIGAMLGARMNVRGAAAAIDDASLVAVEPDDPRLVGRVLSLRGHLRSATDPEAARRDLERAARIAREEDDPEGLRRALFMRGIVEHLTGDLRACLATLRSIDTGDDATEELRRRIHEARACIQLGRLEQARDALDGAVEEARRHGSTRARAMARSLTGWLRSQESDLEGCLEDYRDAIADFDRAGDPVNVALVTGMCGWARLFAGDADGAEPHFVEARERGQRWGGGPHHESSVGIGLVAARRGRWEEAVSLLDEAARRLTDKGVGSTAAHARAACAEAAARLGRTGEARRMMDEAAAMAGAITSPGTSAAVTLVIARTQLVLGVADESELAKRLAWIDAEAVADVSAVARFEVARTRSVLGAEPPPAPHQLVVASDGSWFDDDGRRVEVSGAANRGILAALAYARREAPGSRVPIGELARAGWPSERVPAGTAANRTRVAVAGLRKLGLAEVLRTGRGGYHLDPERPLRIASAGPGGS